MADPHSNKPSTPRPGRDEDDAVERRTLRDYYIILRERVWIALPLALIVSLGIGYWQARKTPIYQSTAKMQFEKPETIVTSQGVVDPSIRSDIDINTYIQILNSDRLRAKVIESFTPDEQKILMRPKLKRLKPGEPAPVTGDIGSVDPEPVRNSYLITVTVSHEDPDAAALVANRYVDQFIQYLFDNVGGKNEQAVDYLRNRAEQLQKDAEAADSQLQAYMREHNLVSLDKSLDIVSERLRSVNSALTSARLELLTVEDVSRQVEEYRKSGKDLMEIGYIASHGPVASLRTELAADEQTQSVLAERYLERNPKMIEIQGKINVTRAQLDKAIGDAIDDLNTRLSGARATVKTLADEYALQEQEEHRLRALGVDFSSLQSKATATKTYYMEILDRLNQTTTTKNLEKIPIHPLDRAHVPGAPSSPNMQGILRTCVGVGVMVFLGVAIGLGFLDDRIKSAWDVESFIGVNLLGIIPNLAQVKDDEKPMLVAQAQNDDATGVESFLGLYSAIKINSRLDFPKSLLVTSTIPGEGKTLISCNLAGCFARHGKKTLLVDCDLRRPMLHRYFNRQNSTGLISWFEEGASLEGDLLTNPSLGISQIGENLFLLTSGGRFKSPTELLETPVFGQLLERLKKHFDLVLVDSPPMGAVSDALLIAERTDEIIYVCRFNRAYRKHIKLYIRALREGKNEILGIVLNGLSPRRIEYYSNYRYYRSYKKYYGAQT